MGFTTGATALLPSLSFWYFQGPTFSANDPREQALKGSHFTPLSCNNHCTLLRTLPWKLLCSLLTAEEAPQSTEDCYANSNTAGPLLSMLLGYGERQGQLLGASALDRPWLPRLGGTLPQVTIVQTKGMR